MIPYLFQHIPIAIRGGGDLGSGVAYRLFRAGFPILITELESPLLVRRAVSYGSAAVQGTITVEGNEAVRVAFITEARTVQSEGKIPVIISPDGVELSDYHPLVLVDARMRKRPPGPHPASPSLVIGLGPGFTAPDNCDAVIETNRGHMLGRVIRQGSAQPDTGIPGKIGGESARRVLRAPADGVLRSLEPIGALVAAGQPLAEVGEISVRAPLAGVLRGLVHDGLTVQEGDKIGDVDPRAEQRHCFTISDKSLAIGGGVLEAILSAPAIRALIHSHQ